MKPRIVAAAAGALLLAAALTQISRPPPEPARPPEQPTVRTTPRVASMRARTALELMPAEESHPARPAVDTATNAAAPASTNWRQILFDAGGELPPLPREAIDRWLASGRTNAEDLLAARQAGGGKEYLLMALTNFPNDPRVLLAATVLDDTPQAQRERLDRFKAAAPDNAVADYLSARDHLKNGRPDQALADLLAASGKPRFNEYTLDSMQNTEELYLHAGRSPVEAKALGTSTALLPQLSQFKGLAQDLAALQRQYLAAGDTGSAEQVAQYGLQLGERLTSGEGSRTLIGQLVGMAVERIALSPLDHERSYDFLQGNVNGYLGQLDARRTAIRESTQFFEQWVRSASEAEVISYFDRLKLYGESEALRWMRQRLGPQ